MSDAMARELISSEADAAQCNRLGVEILDLFVKDDASIGVQVLTLCGALAAVAIASGKPSDALVHGFGYASKLTLELAKEMQPSQGVLRDAEGSES